MSKGKELKHSPKYQSYSNPPLSPSSNPSSKKPSIKTFFPFESQEPKDFSCLVIQSIKSKTQVNSPKFISLLNNSSFSSDSHPDLRSFEFELYQKCSDEKIKKLENELELKSKRNFYLEEKIKKLENEGKQSQTGSVKEKIIKINELLGKFKQDVQGFKDYSDEVIGFNDWFQRKVFEMMRKLEKFQGFNSVSMQSKEGNRRSVSLNFDKKDLRFVYLTTETSKLEGIIMKGIQDMQEFYKKKMKNDSAKSLQIISKLRLELMQQQEENFRLKKNLERANEKLKGMEKRNLELNDELDSVCKENSKIIQDYMRIASGKDRNEFVKEDLDRETKLSQRAGNGFAGSDLLQKMVKDLEMKNRDLQRMIEKITKNSGFSELQKENYEFKCINDDLKDRLRNKEKELSSYSEKIKQLENSLDTLNKLIAKSKEKHFKLNSETKQLKEQEKRRSILYTKSDKLSKLQDFPLNPSTFQSFIPKFESLCKHLESILIFRQNLLKTFTFPDELLVFREVPIKFIEKTLFYFQILMKVVDYFLSIESSHKQTENYIKELELQIYNLQEINQKDKLKLLSYYLEQETILINEIDSLQISVNHYKSKVRKLKKAKAESLSQTLSSRNIPSSYHLYSSPHDFPTQSSLIDCTNHPPKSNLIIEKILTPLVTPTKSGPFTELESKVKELSMSASKYKAKTKELKKEKKELIEELKDLQFRGKES